MFGIDDRVLSAVLVSKSECTQREKPDVMHDRGLLLVLCRDDERHVAAPVPKIGIIISCSLCFVKKICMHPEKIVQNH
jgi:hypothetical protein